MLPASVEISEYSSRLVGWMNVAKLCHRGHGSILLLSIAKWCNLLNSQSPVYDGDRQAPPDLLNLLPEGSDSDPDT
jgi:hypothetical protein